MGDAGDDGAGGAQGGGGAGAQAGAGARADVSGDASADASADASGDASADESADESTDASADASTDAITDAGAAAPTHAEATTSAAHPVLLVGHGAPARDTPRELVARWKALEARRRAAGAHEPTPEEARLDAELRAWPRTDATDPYRAGLEGFAAELRRALAPRPVMVAYNEFCAPSVEAAAEMLVAAGARSVLVVPTMVIPGGVHSEEEIPETLHALTQRYEAVRWVYAWPFSPSLLVALFAAQVESFGPRR